MFSYTGCGARSFPLVTLLAFSFCGICSFSGKGPVGWSVNPRRSLISPARAALETASRLRDVHGNH
eukprot:10596669-Karenia_brevis.AAC.1